MRELFRPYHSKQILSGIIAIAVISRVISALVLGDEVVNLPGTYDQISYNALAIRVLDGNGFSFGQPWWPVTAAGAPTAHWSFLYTLYLVFVYGIFGVHPVVARVLQAVIVGILQPLIMFFIGRRLFSESVGLVSALLTALYTYFIYYSATLMTEPFYITAILGSLYLSILLVDHNADQEKGKHSGKDYSLAAVLGITLGAAVLLRQLFLLLIPFLFLWIFWSSRVRLGRNRIWTLLLSGTIIIVMIVPFTVYNYIRFHRFVLLNTNSGYAFFWANHPIYGTHFVPILPSNLATYQSLIPKELLHLDEAALDQALLKRGIQIVISDPKRYILLSLSRIPPYFMFWPSRDSGLLSNLARVAGFGILLPLMIYGLVYAFSIRVHNWRLSLSSPVFLLYSFILIYSAIHLLSWALIRYRLPVDAILIVFAGLAIVDLYARIRNIIPYFSVQSESN